MHTGAPKAKLLQTSQISMKYLDWGRPDAHPTEYDDTVVLCLHGLASSGKWYDIVLPYLAGSYHCVAPDQRGHGETDQPETGYDWRTLSGDAIILLDHLGYEKAIVLGHSWGAFVALSMAALHPERTAKLCMIDGGYSDWRKWPGANYEAFRQRLRPRNVGGTREEYLAKVQYHLRECWNEKMEEIILSMIRVGEDGQVTDILKPSTHSQILDAMWEEPSSTWFDRVTCPALVVAAGPRANTNPEFTAFRMAMADAAQSAIADCRFEWIPDTIHDIGYHKPAELAKAIHAFIAPS